MITINQSDLTISVSGASTNDKYKFGLVEIIHIPTHTGKNEELLKVHYNML